MRSNVEIDYDQQRSALEFLNISIDDWYSLTPADRRTTYHKKIMRAILENHPDKHPGLAEDSEEYNRWHRNTALLNSINYEYDAPQVNEADIPASSPQAYAAEQSTGSYSSSSVPTFKYPKSIDEFVKTVDEYYHQYTPRDESVKTITVGPCTRAPDNNNTCISELYVKAVKECLPKFINVNNYTEQMDKLLNSRTQESFGRDLPYFLDQIDNKCCHLVGYQGVDTFAAAMISRDKTRIKDAFDHMVSIIKKGGYLSRFFSTPDSRLAEFIDKFCHFAVIMKNGRAKYTGIQVDSVRVLCKSLSLMLPYEIIDATNELDQELIRTLLTRYVSGPAATLQLEDGATSKIEK